MAGFLNSWAMARYWAAAGPQHGRLPDWKWTSKPWPPDPGGEATAPSAGPASVQGLPPLLPAWGGWGYPYLSAGWKFWPWFTMTAGSQFARTWFAGS